VAYTNFAAALENGGHVEPAIQYYYKALAAYPDYELCMFNLAFLLATCPEARLRRPEEAVRLAERACELARDLNPNDLWILATAYAEAGRFDKAATAIEKAIALSQAAGDAKFAEILRGQLQRYREHPGGRDGQALDRARKASEAKVD
jgi:tetratricopeptide (TPR) repeat protein